MDILVPELAVPGIIVRSISGSSPGGGFPGASIIVKRGQAFRASLDHEHTSMTELCAPVGRMGILTASAVRYASFDTDEHVGAIRRRPVPA